MYKCNSIPGNYKLPVPANQDEMNLIYKTIGGNNVRHPLGITDRDSEGNWVNFYTGEALEYLNWSNGDDPSGHNAATNEAHDFAETREWQDGHWAIINQRTGHPMKVICLQENTV